MNESKELKDLEKQAEMLGGMLKQQEKQIKEDRRVKDCLIQELREMMDEMPKYPFYNKYKAIIAKTIIDLQYLT